MKAKLNLKMMIIRAFINNKKMKFKILHNIWTHFGFYKGPHVTEKNSLEKNKIDIILILKNVIVSSMTDILWKYVIDYINHN